MNWILIAVINVIALYLFRVNMIGMFSAFALIVAMIGPYFMCGKKRANDFGKAAIVTTIVSGVTTIIIYVQELPAVLLCAGDALSVIIMLCCITAIFSLKISSEIKDETSVDKIHELFRGVNRALDWQHFMSAVALIIIGCFMLNGGIPLANIGAFFVIEIFVHGFTIFTIRKACEKRIKEIHALTSSKEPVTIAFTDEAADPIFGDDDVPLL